MSDVQGALCHLTLQYVDWLSLQLLPDTAETEWLDRHGQIWLVNSDGTRGRKQATLASGTATFTGVGGAIVPAFTQLIGATAAGSINYETTAQITLDANLPTVGPIRAITPGTAGNQLEGASLSFLATPPQVDGSATVVELDNGTDIETDNELRARILQRIRNPPMGGAVADYEAWALAVPGVTRAWAAPEQGVGTITVRFLMDDLRASDNGWPTPSDVETVSAYIDQHAPGDGERLLRAGADQRVHRHHDRQSGAQYDAGSSADRAEHREHAVRNGCARTDHLCGLG